MLSFVHFPSVFPFVRSCLTRGNMRTTWDLLQNITFGMAFFLTLVSCHWSPLWCDGDAFAYGWERSRNMLPYILARRRELECGVKSVRCVTVWEAGQWNSISGSMICARSYISCCLHVCEQVPRFLVHWSNISYCKTATLKPKLGASIHWVCTMFPDTLLRILSLYRAESCWSCPCICTSHNQTLFFQLVILTQSHSWQSCTRQFRWAKHETCANFEATAIDEDGTRTESDENSRCAFILGFDLSCAVLTAPSKSCFRSKLPFRSCHFYLFLTRTTNFTLTKASNICLTASLRMYMIHVLCTGLRLFACWVFCAPFISLRTIVPASSGCREWWLKTRNE